MIADIFYPIFTLTIIILAYFIRKKAKLFRDLHIRVHQDIALDRLGGARPPASIVFGFAKNRCTHIVFVLSPANVLFVINQCSKNYFRLIIYAL